MASDFVIYHVPSLLKVGCTRNLKKSRKERYAGRQVIVLETIPASKGPKYAGDREWAYAVAAGYKRGNHYLNTWDFKLTKKQRRRFGRLGHDSWTPEGRERVLNAGKWKGPKGVGAYGMNNKTKARIAKIGAEANGRSPNNCFRQQLTCPHCGAHGNGGNMHRWHFDNCKLRPAAW